MTALLVLHLAARPASRPPSAPAPAVASSCSWPSHRSRPAPGPRPAPATCSPAGRCVETTTWVPGLGLTVDLRLDPLSLLMVVLVSGVGVAGLPVLRALLRRAPARSSGASPPSSSAFAGAMLGLVLADGLLLLYVFWELTSVTSFLLIGFDDEQEDSRRAAVQALLVTTLGGLVMLVGLLLLGQAAGTTSITALLADPPQGGVVPVALVCLLVGAFTKSAQVPFHPWLPAAMAAPTPVSAYLHAAAMVKAGVYLVALFAPAFAGVAPWRPLVLDRRPADDARRRLAVAAPDRPQAAARVRHRQPAGLPDRAARRGHPRGRPGRRGAAAGARAVQGHAVPVGRRHRPRDRDARPARAVRARAPAAGAGRRGHGRRAVDGRRAAAARASSPRRRRTRRSCTAGPRTWPCSPASSSARCSPAPTARASSGAPSPPSPASRRPSRTGRPPRSSPRSWCSAPPASSSACCRSWPTRSCRRTPPRTPTSPRPTHLALWHGLSTALLLSAATLGGAAALFAAARAGPRRAARRAPRGRPRRRRRRVRPAPSPASTRSRCASTAVVQTGSLPVYLGTVLVTLVALAGDGVLGGHRA